MIAGAAFAFAPYRLEQDGHLQVISSGGIPLAIAFAVRGHPAEAALVALLGVDGRRLAGLDRLGARPPVRLRARRSCRSSGWWRGSFAAGRRSRGRCSIAGAAGAVVFIAVSYWIAHPYLYIADNFPAAKRSPHEVAAFSGPLKVFLTAPEENWVWGAATAGFRDSLTTLQEKTLFPGAVIVLLAAASASGRAA